MARSKADILAAGKWLAAERSRRGKRCSTTLVAKLATLYANRLGDPVKIHQQQLSAIENATEDSGPSKLPAWWRHVKAIFESGEIDAAVEPIEAAPQPPAQTESEYLIQSATGEIVGRITWFGPRP